MPDDYSHRRFRPGWVLAVYTFGRAVREWIAQDQKLTEPIRSSGEELSRSERRARELEHEIRAAQQVLAHHRAREQEAQRRLNALGPTIDNARSQLGDVLPDKSWWADCDSRELKAPWTDGEWNSARTELFLEALALHKAFLQCSATAIRNNLDAAIDVVKSAAPRDPDDLREAHAVRAAWQTLFFVVPVVSTTFASFAGLFSGLRSESLGWLLIEEAGQATPQAAVGAIWRSKRVVAVGDQLQLEPIVTLPFRVQQLLRLGHGVEEKWLPSRTSVQQLADQVTPLGTELPRETGVPLWVGAPLKVHRRCDEPMFGIINDIYGGFMLNGKPEREEFHPALISPPSQLQNCPRFGCVLHFCLSALVRLWTLRQRSSRRWGTVCG